jgi:3-isopropylmalate/(R)-2-methylmalate dehydratase small subunit
MSRQSETAGRLVRRGICHVLGDEVSLDDGIIPARFAAQRVIDPSALRPHLFETIDPELAQRIAPGDIVIAGRNFACGKPRLQGFIAMAALDLSIICASMPYKMLRRAVARAIPVLVGAPEPCGIADQGDEIEIDFSTGVLRNFTRGVDLVIPAMPPVLGAIVAGGGMQAALQDWLARHPEQA